MEDLSLHILDIAENSINGAAKTIEIIIDEDREKDLLTIDEAAKFLSLTKPTIYSKVSKGEPLNSGW